MRESATHSVSCTVSWNLRPSCYCRRSIAGLAPSPLIMRHGFSANEEGSLRVMLGASRGAEQLGPHLKPLFCKPGSDFFGGMQFCSELDVVAVGPVDGAVSAAGLEGEEC